MQVACRGTEGMGTGIWLLILLDKYTIVDPLADTSEDKGNN